MECFLFGAVLVPVAGYLLLSSGRLFHWCRGAILLWTAGLLAGAGLWLKKTGAREEAFARSAQVLPREGRPGGYVSSQKCEACHPSQYASWHRTYHRTMTQYATPESLLGRFEGQSLLVEGETFRLERRGDDFLVEMEDPDWLLLRSGAREEGKPDPPRPPRVWRRVGMLTGSHHLQVPWVNGSRGNQQIVLPLAWLKEESRWVPFRDTFLRDPTQSERVAVWNTTCLQCHTTSGQPRPEPGTGILDTRTAEMGIACEVCHGPAEPHVRGYQNPLRRYHLLESAGSQPAIVNPAKLPSKLSAQVCGQCHAIKWIPDSEGWRRNGIAYRPGDDLNLTTPPVRPTRIATDPRMKALAEHEPKFTESSYWPDGMVRVVGREYNGLVESPCFQRGELTCLSCHSLHRSDPDDQLAARMETNAACLQCHEKLRADLSRHTHHGAASSGSLCYNCHMPHTTYGLLKAERSHQIDSPRAAVSLATGRPNACNLCHLDRSLGWTAHQLTAWYGQLPAAMGPDEENVAASILWVLKGDAGLRALGAYSMGWDAAREVSGDGWLAPFLAALLEDPYSAVRYIAQRSLRRLPGYRDFRYDFVGPSGERPEARRRALEIWGRAPAGAKERESPEVLIAPGRLLDRERLERILSQRDNRSMSLEE